MLYRHGEVFRSLLLFTDLLLVAAAWGLAYALRFAFFEAPLGTPPADRYAWAGLLLLPVWAWIFRSHDLYEPKRTGSLLQEAGDVLRACSIGVVLLLAADAAFRTFLSRGVIAVFWPLSVVAVTANRVVIRSVLRRLRRSGYNLRYVLIVGAGELAAEVIERINAHPEAGLRVIGALSDDASKRGRTIRGVPVLAGTSAIKEVMAPQRVDQVILALPREDAPLMQKLLTELDDEVVSVRLVPDLLGLLTLRSTLEELDGLPVIGLRESPFVGWAAVQKRVFDAVGSALALVLVSPVLLLVSLAVLASAGRPLLFAQERMGLDGRVFRMFKFRTMRRDAESESGPVWTRPDDPRRTRVGAFLRRTGLDELPQLWNVLRGDMSLVGPRPERPVFIEEFRREIPGYMLRHKVKAGLTGWAQIHGWRGNTSLHERLEHDIHYIQNWSLGFDLRILLLTLWRGWRSRNGY
jgi:Undecaprenyl-phosphate glucose phosphotransferase